MEKVVQVFKRVYTEAVYAKMLFNNINFVMTFEKKELIELPKCVTKNSLRTLMGKYRTKITDYASDVELDG